jgi:polyphosphate kinase
VTDRKAGSSSPPGRDGEQVGITREGGVDLDDPKLFINREIGWLQFNERVVEEAEDAGHPLLERVKFFAICGSNLDEFFMVRVSGLRRQMIGGVAKVPPDGMTPGQQMDAIQRTLEPLLARYARCWKEDLLPALRSSGIRIHRCADLPDETQELLRQHFRDTIFPVLTPLAFDATHPFPFISGLSLNLVVVIRHPERGRFFARVKIPLAQFPRLVRIPSRDTGDGRTYPADGADGWDLVFIEDLMASHLDLLFPGMEILAAYPFRVSRDADIEIREDEAPDLVTAIEESMEMRRTGSPVRLEVGRGIPDHICDMLAGKLALPPYLVTRSDGPMGMADLMELTSLPRPDLKDRPFLPAVPPVMVGRTDLFSVIRQRDVILYHPYDSFIPFIDFLQGAARDPRVLAIKITLYRIDTGSPIVAALIEAREHGKQVSAVIELKARFDEQRNIQWAKALERAGVHVVYGVPGLKVHAKVCMVVRREEDGIRRYVHLSTGNYNPSTARIYGDIGLFTTDPGISEDASDLFNALTGFSLQEEYRKLLVAPVRLRRELLTRIEREIARHRSHGDGYIAIKVNALEDRECIQALYRASMAGVRVDLNVRGFSCLRPGIPGISDRIRVTSIVDRFLEHARIYAFHNGGNPEVLMGSADMRPRNFDRRVETLFPVQDPAIRDALLRYILQVHLRDSVKARELQPDGSYRRVVPESGEEPVRSQQWLIDHRGCWHRGA